MDVLVLGLDRNGERYVFLFYRTQLIELIETWQRFVENPNLSFDYENYSHLLCALYDLEAAGLFKLGVR